MRGLHYRLLSQHGLGLCERVPATWHSVGFRASGGFDASVRNAGTGKLRDVSEMLLGPDELSQVDRKRTLSRI